MSGLVWLITGCSPGGFGEYFVRSILARGDKVIATARNADKLQLLKQKNDVEILQLDITDTQDNVNAIVQRAISIYGHIDVLVNNAAFIQVGTLEDLEYTNWLEQFDTNVFGSIKVTKALLPHLRQRKKGTNVFISSLSGWIGHPFCGPYASSKFALEGVVEALSKETAPLGIKTLMIEPGRFRTLLLSGGNRKTRVSSIPDYEQLSNDLVEGLSEEDQRQPGDPVKLAEIVVDLVRGEGVAKDKDVPLRMPLGLDCYDEIKEKCEETLRLLEDWKGVIRSTDHD